jgi:hypothetical protein
MSLHRHIIELRAAFGVYVNILDALLERVVEFETEPARAFVNCFRSDNQPTVYSSNSDSDSDSDNDSDAPTTRSSPINFPQPPSLIRQQAIIIDLDDEPDERVYKRMNYD